MVDFFVESHDIIFQVLKLRIKLKKSADIIKLQKSWEIVRILNFAR